VSNVENTPSTLPSNRSSAIFQNRKNIAACQAFEQNEQLGEQPFGRKIQALLALARSNTIEQGDLKAALTEITEVAASVLEVQRTSVWLYRDDTPSQTIPLWFFSPVGEAGGELAQQSGTVKLTSVGRSRIQCLDLYDQSQGCHTSGMELAAANYPAYFQALAIECTIAADDAHTDPRTREFAESYLTPHGIAAMLDAPIWLNGQMVGLVCHEHIGSPRQWTSIEEDFVTAIAALVAMTIKACERVLAQKQLRQHHQHLLSEYYDDLERLVEERTAQLTQANEKLQREINKRSSVEARVRKYQHHLEELVEERTREIIQTNEQLQQEINRHKLAQEALRESEEQFRCLSEATFEAVLITDRGKLVSVNHNFTTLFGYDGAEVIGMNTLDFVAPEDRTCVQEIMALNSEQMYESLCLRKDGTTFPAEVRSKAIPYRGQWVRVTAIRDVTAQSQAQEELKKSVSLLHATLNSTTDGIIAVSITGEIVSFNQKFIEMWGVPEEIIKSPNYQERLKFLLTKLKEPKVFLSRIKELDAQPEAEGYDVLELQDGRIFERLTQPQRSGQQIIGRVWSFRDITQRARAEVALRQHLQQQKLIAVMCDRIRQSLNLKEILNTTVEEVRQFLQTDRVLIYRFETDWSGSVVVESVASDYMTILDRVIHDPCFGGSLLQPYQQGRIQATTDIREAELTPCHVKFLANLQVRANLVVPILQGASHQERLREHEDGENSSTTLAVSATCRDNSTSSLPTLWGLLIAHHCSGPRAWQPLEIDLLKSLATQVAIAIQQSSLFEQLEAANQKLQHLACVDGLTQVANRRRFDEYLDVEWRRLAREQKPLSLILCDLDYFKVYNDTYGHLAGDLCLQQVGRVLHQALKRPADLVARYGGEEFAVILPNTDATGAVLVAEMIREGLRALKIAHAKSLVSEYVTLSLGVASFVPTPNASPDKLIAAADEALYRAKAEGRDRLWHQ